MIHNVCQTYIGKNSKSILAHHFASDLRNSDLTPEALNMDFLQSPVYSVFKTRIIWAGNNPHEVQPTCFSILENRILSYMFH